MKGSAMKEKTIDIGSLKKLIVEGGIASSPARILDENNDVAAEVYGDWSQSGPNAIATLFAAAPDMLEALQRLVREVREWDGEISIGLIEDAQVPRVKCSLRDRTNFAFCTSRSSQSAYTLRRIPKK